MRNGLPILLLLLALSAGADVLETRDGRILEGVYLGGTHQTVRFETNGTVEVLPRDRVLALTFALKPQEAPTASATPPAAATTPAPSAAATPAVRTVSETKPAPTLARVPAGTRLQVRMVDAIDGKLAAAGDTFSATLETGLGLQGRPIVPAGTEVWGRVAEVKSAGAPSTRIKLELSRLLIQGHMVDLVTGSQTLAGAAPAPAAPGVAGEAAPEATPGFPSGTVLEFRLLQPFDLRIR